MAGRQDSSASRTEPATGNNSRSGVEVELPRRILKGPSAGAIMTHVLLEQLPDLVGSFRRSLRRGEPALDLRSKVLIRCDGRNLELRGTKELEQLAERQRPNVRCVAQCFPAILERSPLRVL